MWVSLRAGTPGGLCDIVDSAVTPQDMEFTAEPCRPCSCTSFSVGWGQEGRGEVAFLCLHP